MRIQPERRTADRGQMLGRSRKALGTNMFQTPRGKQEEGGRKPEGQGVIDPPGKEVGPRRQDPLRASQPATGGLTKQAADTPSKKEVETVVPLPVGLDVKCGEFSIFFPPGL